MRHFINDKEIKKCLNFECDILLVDREFLVSQFYEEIKRIIISLKMRNIDNREYNTSKYCELNFYITKILNNKASTIAYFKREMHMIDNLRTKMLIDINILKFKIIVFDVT